MPDDIRWIRSYVLDEGDARLGTVCIYEASSPQAIREHASRAELAADEIIPVADTVIVRADPEPATTYPSLDANRLVDGHMRRSLSTG
jgi:Protein of unknown function (DUF4242)